MMIRTAAVTVVALPRAIAASVAARGLVVSRGQAYEVAIERDAPGWGLSWRSMPSGPSGRCWHASEAAAREYARVAFGIPPERWDE